MLLGQLPTQNAIRIAFVVIAFKFLTGGRRKYKKIKYWSRADVNDTSSVKGNH